MADAKISELPDGGTVEDTDEIPVNRGGTTYKVTGAGTGSGSDDQTAAEVPFTPGGTISSTDTQAAVEEVSSDAASALSTHAAVTTSVHGITDTSALLDTGDIGVTVQAHDADLDTYAGITPSANVQSVLGAANYAAIRTLLGLVIGTNVQAFDADLSTWAGLTPSAFFQTLVDDTDAATARATLGVIASLFQNGGAQELSLAGLDGTPTDLQSHLDDAGDAHDASAISVLDTAANFTGSDVEAVLAELQDNIAAGGGGSVATPPFLGYPGSLSSAALGNTDVYLLKVWVPVDMDINKISLGIVTSAGNLLLGIYSSAGARLYTSGSVASPGTGARSHTTSVTVSLSAGWVYAAVQASDATFATYLGSAGAGVSFSFSNSFGSGLPANLPALTNLVSPVTLTLHP